MIVCPACGENNEDKKKLCTHCFTDLSSLLRLREAYKIHYNNGLALAKFGKFHEAVESLLLSASLYPRQENSYILLGKLFAGREDYETAYYFFNKAKAIVPGNGKIDECINKVEELSGDLPHNEDTKFLKGKE